MGNGFFGLGFGVWRLELGFWYFVFCCFWHEIWSSELWVWNFVVGEFGFGILSWDL